MNFIITKVAYANIDTFMQKVDTEIINPIILLLFALALVYFLYGVFEFIASEASDEKKTIGKDHMIWGIIGLTVMIGVWFILGLILDTFNISRDQIDPENGKVDLPDPVSVGAGSNSNPRPSTDSNSNYAPLSGNGSNDFPTSELKSDGIGDLSYNQSGYTQLSRRGGKPQAASNPPPDIPQQEVSLIPQQTETPIITYAASSNSNASIMTVYGRFFGTNGNHVKLVTNNDNDSGRKVVFRDITIYDISDIDDPSADTDWDDSLSFDLPLDVVDGIYDLKISTGRDWSNTITVAVNKGCPIAKNGSYVVKKSANGLEIPHINFVYPEIIYYKSTDTSHTGMSISGCGFDSNSLNYLELTNKANYSIKYYAEVGKSSVLASLYGSTEPDLSFAGGRLFTLTYPKDKKVNGVSCSAQYEDNGFVIGGPPFHQNFYQQLYDMKACGHFLTQDEIVAGDYSARVINVNGWLNDPGYPLEPGDSETGEWGKGFWWAEQSWLQFQNFYPELLRRSDWSNSVNVKIVVDKKQCSITTKDIVPGSIKVVSNPAYVTKTETDKKFTPKAPYNVYDTVDVTLSIKKPSENCLFPQSVLSGAVKIKIEGKDIDLMTQVFPTDATVIQENTFHLESESGDTGIYRGTFSSNFAVAKTDVQEKIVDSIDKKIPVNVLISSPDSILSEGKPLEVAVPMTNCVQLYGSGEHKIITMRGTRSALSVTEEIKKADIDTRLNGFEKIEPLKTYKQHFMYFADLKRFIGDKELLTKLSSGVKARRSMIGLYSNIPSKSTCGGSGKAYLLYVGEKFSSGSMNDVLGLAAIGSPVALVSDKVDSETIVHEVGGHTIGKLSDEYLQGGATYEGILDTSRNCAQRPVENYSFLGKIYGDTNMQGCTVNFLVKRPTRSASQLELSGKVFRPSPASIMNMELYQHEFNAVSCGYIISGILGGDPKSYFPQCSNIKGVILPLDFKTPNLDASVINAMGGYFYAVFSELSYLLSSSKLTPEVVQKSPKDTVNALESNTQPVVPVDNIEFLIAENFDKQNPKGEIVEVVPDGAEGLSSLSFKNSILVPPQKILFNKQVSIGGFNVTLKGGPVIVKNLPFTVTIKSSDVDWSKFDISNIELRDSKGTLVSKGVKNSMGEIVFSDGFTVSATSGYKIYATIKSNFKTLILSANFYKNDAVFVQADTSADIEPQKSDLTLSTMTAALGSAN